MNVTTYQNFGKQFPLNLVSNIILFFLNLLVGIWITPFFIKSLGITGYSIIPLVTTSTAYAGLFTVSFHIVVSRFLTIALQKKDFYDANKIFNTAFWLLSLLSFILLLLACAISWFAPVIFKIPSGIENESRWLFFWVFSSFVLSVFSSNFTISAYAFNRLDLSNTPKIVDLLIRTACVVLFFMFVTNNLFYVGISYFIASIASLIVSVIIWKNLTGNLHISLKCFDRTQINKLFSMGKWVFINQIGALLFLKIDIIVVNLLFGPEATGQYGAILQWNILLRALAGVFAGVFSPMILISFAKEDKNKIIQITTKAIKFLAIMMALPIGILCGFGKEILLLWLGKDFVPLTPLLWLMVSHLVLNLSILPILNINTAFNKVRFPGIITLLCGMGNLFLAIFLSKHFNIGYYGVAMAGLITLTLKNLIFTPLYGAHILKIPLHSFLKPLVAGTISAFAVFAVSYGLAQVMLITTWKELILLSGGIGLLFILFSCFVLLNTKEKKMLKSVILLGR
jgi:O-antigen/teichoic acid export membrane protein